jgi:hypothetical protein
MSAVLVGVPELVGLTVAQAQDAVSGRGLVLHHPSLLLRATQVVVASQDPEAPGLAARGSAVNVTLAPAKGAALAVRVRPARFVCAGGSVLRLRVQLSEPAFVRKRLLNSRGRVVTRGVVGKLRAGASTVRIKLPRKLRRGAYRLVLDATRDGRRARAVVRVKVGSRVCKGA